MGKGRDKRKRQKSKRSPVISPKEPTRLKTAETSRPPTRDPQLQKTA